MSKCRSCGAEVIFALTERGKTMPIDPHPVEGGNILLVEKGGGVTSAIVVGGKYGGTRGYRSHFATCPQATKWRKDRKT